MTDAALSAERQEARAALEKRLAARHRSERRFQYAGIAAVSVAVLSLLMLVCSLMIQGVSAFVAYEIRLEVAVPESVDPERTGDPAVIRRANFNGLIQDTLRTEFPAVTDRGDLRELFGLVSSVNAGTLLDEVLEEPFVVGRTVSLTAPIADDVDLYLKGKATSRDRRNGRGDAQFSTEGDVVEISSSAADFAFVLEGLKADLLADADRTDADAARMALETVSDDPARARTRQAQLETTQARAADLRARAAEPSSPEEMSSTTPTLLVRIGGGVVRATEASANTIRGEWLSPGEPSGRVSPGDWSLLYLATPQSDRRVTDRQIVWAEDLAARGQVGLTFNHWLFTRSDSREPELAGMMGAFIGSILTMLVTMLLAAPIGVATAIYLEEFAPKNRLTDLIEVNINNLAAVPSIVFGLLGLAMFLNFFGLPRSAPLVGGLVLALLVLPTIIIASRAALKAVPPSIKEAALGVGASHQQAIFHHVLPLAMPGIMTGTIIGMAHALGETAPLLLIGMIAFIVDVPSGVTQASTVLPVQIFLWSDLPEVGFQAKTSAAIVVLLMFLLVMNGLAILLRRRFERRW